MLEIVQYPHPALRYESRLVTRIDQDLRRAARAMFDLMYQARGIGLAANQVGLPFRFFVMNLTADPDQKDAEQVVINPEILPSTETEEDEEGCLSFPGLYGRVRRPRKIRLRAMDLSGRIFEREATELLARCIQHETDHVLGRLYIDYFSPDLAEAVAPRIAEIEQGFRAAQSEGKFPSDDEIQLALDEMVKANRMNLPPVPEPSGS